MTPIDAFYRTVHDHPGGCESLAPRMGMTAAVLRNKANPHNDSNKPLLVDADLAMAITGDYSILDALCANHGGVFVRLDPAKPASDMAVLEAMAKLWCHNGDFGQTIEQALEDGRIDQQEIKIIRDAAYRFHQSIEAICGRLGEMAEK